MTRYALLLVLLVADPAAARPSSAESIVPAPDNAQADGPLLNEASSYDGAQDDPEVRRLSIELDRAELRALIDRAQFAAEVDRYQATMYRHHQFWTDAAAIAVYIITFFGLVCAAVQFRLIDRVRGLDVTDDNDHSAGAVELPGGAKINSPFLGVIILFISLAFFYLYLINVYPILSVAEIEAKRAQTSFALPPAK